MPKAVIADAFGPPETYELRDFDPGPPDEGEVRVALKFAGISFVDVLTARGEYQFKPPLPYIPGSEASGIVEALGEGVSGLRVGDRVMCGGMGGQFAQVNNFAARTVTKVPDGMSLETAAVFSVNYGTAHHALVDRGRAQPGETLLVLGAAGGTGFAAVQVGKALGLRVIASSSTADKRQATLGGGADVAIETGADDWRDQVKDANDGKPVDLVFDPVGGDLTELAFRTLGYDGRHLVIGFPAGIARLPTNLPLLKCASLVGVQMLGQATHRPEEAEANRQRVFELGASGELEPAIAARHAIEDYAAAMAEAFSGKAAGRVLLVLD